MSPHRQSSSSFLGRSEWLRLGSLALLALVVVVMYRQLQQPDGAAKQPPPASIRADEKPRANDNLFPVPERFGEESKRLVLTAAVAVGLGHPLATSAVLRTSPPGEEAAARTPPQGPNAQTAPPIEAEILAGVEDKAPVRDPDENLFESQAYTYVLVQASRRSPQAFARSARRNVTFAHLFEEPSNFRGQVIHLQGQLRMLREFDAPRLAVKEGVKRLYEAWIFDTVHVRNAYCVILTELPPGLEPGERLDKQVSFDGYFFKRYRYKAGDGFQHDAPLLIGRTVTLRPNAAAAEPDSPLYAMFLPIFLTVLSAMVVLGVGLAWWFRRGDRRVRASLARAVLPSFPVGENPAEPEYPGPGSSNST